MDAMEMNISAYGHMRDHLESKHSGEWVVFIARNLPGPTRPTGKRPKTLIDASATGHTLSHR